MKTSKSYTVEEATARLERYCAYQERCHLEVERKLKEMNMIPEARDHILLHLMQHNFLNEERFARAFARGKFRTKKWGKVRIVNELRMRNISRINIKLALREIPDKEYYQTFDQLLEKRLNQLESEKASAKKRKKIADYLLYRGWESEMVYDAINRL